MAQKDIAQKLLEDYEDVFADIVNVLVFDGEKVVRPDALEPSNLLSQYKAVSDGKLHEQERDVVKYWKDGDVRIGLIGLENQTKVEREMVLRVLGYDGAAYRDQLHKEMLQCVGLWINLETKAWSRVARMSRKELPKIC